MSKAIEDKELKKNGSGYNDPTAYKAIKHIEDREVTRNKVLHTIFHVCELAGFRVKNRIILQDKESGHTYD